MAAEKYNQDELVPPSFIDEAYLVQMIRKIENDLELHVLNYDIKPGSKAGDHYASIMFKIIVTYGTKGKIVNDRRLILKTIPEAEGHKKEILESMPAFPNEISMYTKTLPAMEALLKEQGENIWWPKMVFSQAKPFVLVFDDLSVENYEMVYDTLSFDQMPLILEKLAKYHALGLILIDRGNSDLKSLKNEMGPEMKPMFVPMLRIFRQVAEQVKTWNGFNLIGDKLIDLSEEKLLEKIFALMQKDFPNDYHVLNHGDFHIRNLMFKRDPCGELNDVIFLDFQLPNYNLPGFDVFGFMSSMVNEEVRKREPEVLKMYQQILAETLKKYNYSNEIPSLIDINVALLRIQEYNLFYYIIARPLFALKGYDLGDFFTPEPLEHIVKAVDGLLKDPVVIDDLKFMLTKFDSLGVLD